MIPFFLTTLLVAVSGLWGTQADSEITGSWTMYKVVQDSKDVTSEHDPYNERWASFSEDGTFKSGGRPFGANSGRYSFDAQSMELFLDSDIGPGDDSNWRVTFRGDTMHWQGFGSEWADDFELYHIRHRQD